MVEARRILQTLIDLTFPIPIVVIGVWCVRALFNTSEGYTSKELLCGAAKVGAVVAVFVSFIFLDIESENIKSVLRVHPALGIPAGLSAVLGLACLGLAVYLGRREAAVRIDILDASKSSDRKDVLASFMVRGLLVAWGAASASGIFSLWVVSRR
jgi:hypothetical protein